MTNKSGEQAHMNYEYFIHALKYKVKHGGNGSKRVKQKEIALVIDCTPEHLSGILSHNQRRKASLHLQEIPLQEMMV